MDGFMVVGEFKRGYDVERVDIVDSFRLSSSLESALAGTLVEWTDLADPELIEPVPANSITRHLIFNHTNLYFVGTDQGKNCRITFKLNTIGLTVIYMLTYLLGTINPQIIDKMSSLKMMIYIMLHIDTLILSKTFLMQFLFLVKIVNKSQYYDYR